MLNASAYALVQPSFIEPEFILPYAQASGAFDLIEGGGPRIRLSEGDLWVYMKRIDIRTQIASGANAYNNLPGVSFTMGMIQMPTYLFQVRSEYNHHDTAAAARWGASLPELYRLGMRQAHFQLARSTLLYGMFPQNGEGIINAPNATALNLPADSNGNTTISTYDAGQLAFFLLTTILNMKTRTNQLGMGQEFTICAPQRLLGFMEYPDIVQLTQFQREGAGSANVKQMFEDILQRNGDILRWTYDDTLIGKGAGGTDLIVITMPTVKKPTRSGINTNEFAKFTPGNNACAVMYGDMAAPREITTPMPGGATDVLSEWRLSPGWMVRTEAVTLISALYS